MTDNNGADAQYLFGYSEEETRRLLLQGRLFNPYTRRLLEDAGITSGMKVLDVGSGAGDVALLAADLVGPDGIVVGADSNALILDTARKRAQAAGLKNTSFVATDINQLALHEDFDAVVGRCVLFFLSDPAAVLCRLASHLRPGGIVAFQEPGNATLRPDALPSSPLLEQMWEWIMETYRRAGMDLKMGLRLFPLFLEAGLPAPQMRLDAAVGGGHEWAGYGYIASLLRTLLPLMEKFGVATAEEVNIDTFEERFRDEVASQGGVVTTWSFISAWATPALGR
jgi:ubiquinone/menaquinone biosynthesis C-methylase UbiE